MSEERLIILKLLEQGKITESEAEQLLDALGDMEYDEVTQEAYSTFNPEKINLSKDNNTYKSSKNKENTNSSRKHNDFEELLDSIGEKFESMGEHLEDKIDVFGEHFGKRMINLGSMFADKSVSFVEKVVDVVEKAVESDGFSNSDFFGVLKCYEEIIEKDIDNTSNLSLQFKAHNGSVSIASWKEPKIKVVASIYAKEGKYKAVNPLLCLKEDDSNLYFYPRETDNISIKLNVFLPEKIYSSVKVVTKNGFIEVKDLNCNKLFLQTGNSSIKLIDTIAENEIVCTTTNNKITIENCDAENLLAASKNGRISVDKCNLTRLEALTSNSRITIRDMDYSKLESLSLKTTNAKIEVFGPIPKKPAFEIKAITTHGNVNINIPIIYIENIKNYSNHRITAQTPNFNISDSIIYVKAHTTNSNIYFY